MPPFSLVCFVWYVVFSYFMYKFVVCEVCVYVVVGGGVVFVCVCVCVCVCV